MIGVQRSKQLNNGSSGQTLERIDIFTSKGRRAAVITNGNSAMSGVTQSVALTTHFIDDEEDFRMVMEVVIDETIKHMRGEDNVSS
jgi:hypothetical protein